MEERRDNMRRNIASVAGVLGVGLWAGQIITQIVAEVPGPRGRQFASAGPFKWWCHGLAPQGCPTGFPGKFYNVGPFGLWMGIIVRLLFFVVPLLILAMYRRRQGVRAVFRASGFLLLLSLLEHTLRVVVGAVSCWTGGNDDSWCRNANSSTIVPGVEVGHLGISIPIVLFLVGQFIAFTVTYIAAVMATYTPGEDFYFLQVFGGNSDRFAPMPDASDAETARPRGSKPTIKASIFGSGVGTAAQKRN